MKLAVHLELSREFFWFQHFDIFIDWTTEDTDNPEKKMQQQALQLKVDEMEINVIGLKTRKNLYGVDYMIMNRGISFEWLEENDELELITIETAASDRTSDSVKRTRSGLSAKRTLSNYEVLQIIGKGGFSIVYVIRWKSTAKIFAMKSMDKGTLK